MTSGPSFSSGEKVICSEFSGPETGEGALTHDQKHEKSKNHRLLPMTISMCCIHVALERSQLKRRRCGLKFAAVLLTKHPSSGA